MNSFPLALPIQWLPIQTVFDTTSFVHIAAMLVESINVDRAGKRPQLGFRSCGTSFKYSRGREIMIQLLKNAVNIEVV